MGESDANFDYAIGNLLVAGQAHCVGDGAWTTLDDGVVHYALSQSSREMVRMVCSYSNQGTVVAAVPLPSSAPISTPIEVAATPVPATPAPAVSVRRPSARSPRPASTQTALVYDPSSNVRATPNGQILCSIDTRAYINIYGSRGDWYRTDACGEPGVIHISQIQF
ncbi:MAG: hypothetical protein AAGL17_06415 [Cyanobacteria bacterium J06576_12]